MTGLDSNLPETLLSVRTRPLFVMRLDVHPYQIIGGPEGAFRRVGVVPGGLFKGERLSGKIKEGGSDWQTVRAGGKVEIDCKLVLETDDGATIGMAYKGVRGGPPEVLQRLNAGQAVDPSEYYFRINPVFETASHYDWLNGIIGIGIGHRGSSGVLYNVFEVL